MNNKDMITRWEHDIVIEKMDRTIHRFWVLAIMLIIALLGTNGAWIWYESQWETVQESTTQTIETSTDGGGDAIGVMGDNNEVNYGAGESDENEDN